MAVLDLDERVRTLETTITRLQDQLSAMHRDLGSEREKVLNLESEVAQLRNDVEVGPGRKRDWRRVVGLFADDPGFVEAVKLGKEYRDAQRVTDDE